MPMFGWMRWLQEARGQTQGEAASLKTPGLIRSSRMLTRELLWHVEERERMVWELELEQRMAHSTLGFHWFQKYPRLRTLMSTSELHHIECLCAQISPVHTDAVLSRFREVLATNNVLQWEMVHVFERVLRDFQNKHQCEEEEEEVSTLAAWLRPLEAWTNHCQMKQGFVTETVPDCVHHAREEIPTISGHVDRAMRRSSSFSGNGDQGLPFYYSVPLRPTGNTVSSGSSSETNTNNNITPSMISW